MRICLLSKMFPPLVGGSGLYAYEIANALANHGHEVDVYTQQSPGERRTRELNSNVSITTVSKTRKPLVTFETLYYSINCRNYVDFDNYDVIHGTLMPASPIALKTRELTPPLVVTSHGSSLGEVLSHKLEVPSDYLKKFLFHPINVGLDTVTAIRADRIIAISSNAYAELESYYPISSERLRLVQHGVDSNRYNPRAGTHPAVSDDKFTLLHVGRLVSRKHVDLALESVSACDCDEIELLIAGTGRHRDRLESKADQFGIREKVHFLGHVPEDELPPLYASSDLFLFLSRYEGFGLTFLESMASGTPVVGTAVGGFPDVVTDGENGFIVERSPKAVSSAIDLLATKSNQYDDLCKKARDTATNHTWAKTAEQTVAIYRELV